MKKEVKTNTYTWGTSFLIDNKKVNPPPGGWKKPHKNTPHSKPFIQLFHQKQILPDKRPTDIWRRFPHLCVVDPDYFINFKRSCVNAFQLQQQATKIKP
jgi:hypothetical protein